MHNIINFTKQKQFAYLKDLGHGACGKTILMEDEILNHKFVCKKFSPLSDLDITLKKYLFTNFINEIKLLYLVHHKNIARIYNYYLYPERSTGYIVMDYIEGSNIEQYVKNNPERINEVFIQVIDGFYYLEAQNILHRDIRSENILVTDNHLVKIIDFGFGKEIKQKQDLNRTITLNEWCALPEEHPQKNIPLALKYIILDNYSKNL